MIKKYLVKEGYVISDDGDRHFINCKTLINLYNVNISECVLQYIDRRTIRDVEHLIVLTPKSNGDYNIPAKDLLK